MGLNSVRRQRLRSSAFVLVVALPATVLAQGTPQSRSPPGALRASAPPERGATRTSDMFRDPVFVEVEGGASYMALLSVRGGRSVFPNMVTYTGWGPGVGVTAGLHALVFSVGVQVYASFLDGDGTVLNPTPQSGGTAPGSFYMVATTLEGGLRLPMGRLELSLRIGVGHMFLGGFASSASTGFSNVSADGWTVRGGIGFDVRIYRRFFLGFDTDVAFANVRRAGIAGTDCPGGDPFCAELQQSGDAVALMVHPRLQFGAHF